MIVLKPGVYEYVCPGCKRSTSFTVPFPPTCKVDCREREDYGPLRVPDMRPSVKSYNPDDLKVRASKEEWKTRRIVSQPSAEDLKPTKEDIQRYDELYRWEQTPLPNTMFD